MRLANKKREVIEIEEGAKCYESIELSCMRLLMCLGAGGPIVDFEAATAALSAEHAKAMRGSGNLVERDAACAAFNAGMLKALTDLMASAFAIMDKQVLAIMDKQVREWEG
jgi:hypothetical protein